MLPILISIPHGGTRQPAELEGRVCLSEQHLFDDGDAFTREIFDVREAGASVISADVARAFVDLNRAPDDRPPANPDGVVKSLTCFKRPIYHPGAEPDDSLVELLLARYHRPYHERLRSADPSEIRLALDCHSMAVVAPPIAPHPGRPRPLLCLSNADGTTCPAELLESLADALADAFECEAADVTLNDPFKGGYITRTHGGGEIPWIQVEMNRSLYLREPWFGRDRLRVDPSRLASLRDRFLAALGTLNL
ncbi:MAG: N-formylglutamate amidohydrolase [Gemmatimonadota bacterium]|nr:MAG: N-formylglutamate amidohydrolase [Gemmatimonadota bacterium]